MRKFAAAGAVLVALAFASVSAIAHDTVFNTQITLTHAESTSNGGFHFEASGELSSPNEKLGRFAGSFRVLGVPLWTRSD